MDRQRILQDITDLMRELADDDSIVITEQSTMEDVEAWDSLLHVKLMIAIARSYNIRFATADVTEPENVKELIDLIETKL